MILNSRYLSNNYNNRFYSNFSALIWQLSQVPAPAASTGLDHLIILIKAPRLIQLVKEGQTKTAGRGGYRSSLGSRSNTSH